MFTDKRPFYLWPLWKQLAVNPFVYILLLFLLGWACIAVSAWTENETWGGAGIVLLLATLVGEIGVIAYLIWKEIR